MWTGACLNCELRANASCKLIMNCQLAIQGGVHGNIRRDVCPATRESESGVGTVQDFRLNKGDGECSCFI